jgi:hypothetical protein
MSNRTVRFIPALLAGVVAGANLATMTDLRAQTAERTTDQEAGIQVAQATTDSCLAAPKGATPSGSHWYYRIDRTTKRQCWYLREESDKADDKFARAAPPASAPSSAAAEQAPTISRKSIADARAEWVSQQARAESNSPAGAETQTVAAVATPAAQNNAPPMPNVLAPAPLSSVRWNDAPATGTSSNSAAVQTAAATAPAADQPSQQQAAEVPQADEMQQPAADPVTQIAPAAAEPVTAKPTASLQMLLLVIAAALALAGVTVSAIVRIGRMRARRAMRRKRRAMWDAAKTMRRSSPPMFHDEDAGLRRPGGVQHTTRMPKERPRVPQERVRAPQERIRVAQERPRAPQERARAPQERAHTSQDRERQVTEMLARLARSAQT